MPVQTLTAPRTQRSQRGQGLIEYLALTALIAVVCVGTVKFLGSRVKSRMVQITRSFDSAVQSGLRNRTVRAQQNDDDDSDNDSNDDGESSSTGGGRNTVRTTARRAAQEILRHL